MAEAIREIFRKWWWKGGGRVPREREVCGLSPRPPLTRIRLFTFRYSATLGGCMVLEARTAARRMQAELADLAGTTQAVIARLEDADYEGHSLRMLRRIARALNRELEIRLVGG